MDGINTHFLTPKALTNVKEDIEIIKDHMIKFIGGGKTTLTLSKVLANVTCKENFLEVNKAVFKAMEFFIFYKVGYDYKKLEKVRECFYRYLYVANELIKMYDLTKTDEYYTDALKKLISKSSNFARQMSNPLTAKGEKKVQGMLNILQTAVIDPRRLTRQQHIEALKEVDKQVASFKLMLSVAETQDLKLKQKIENLLQEYSNDQKNVKRIVDIIIAGTKITFPEKTVGGKKKGHAGGDGNDAACIVGYFENNVVFNITGDNIIQNKKGLFTVNITRFKTDDGDTLPTSVLPEVSKLIDKYNNRSNTNLQKILYAEKIIKELATNGVAFEDTFKKIKESAMNVISIAKANINKFDSFTARMNRLADTKKKIAAAHDASTAASKSASLKNRANELAARTRIAFAEAKTAEALANASKKPLTLTTSEPALLSLRGGGSADHERIVEYLDIKDINTFITELKELLSKRSETTFKIIKSKYEKTPQVILNKKIESLL